MHETEAADNLGYIQFISWHNYDFFPPDYLEGEWPRQSLITILGAAAYLPGSWKAGLDILWGLTQLKTRQHGKLQIQDDPREAADHRIGLDAGAIYNQDNVY